MPILSDNEFENLIFSYMFLTRISKLVFHNKILKFQKHVNEGQLEESVSQIVYLGLYFHFMRSEK